MKISAGRVLGLAMVLLIGGGALCFGAYMMGADPSIHWNGLRIGSNGVNNISDDTYNKEVKTISEALEAFNEISLNLNAMDLEIKTGATYQLEAKYFKKSEISYKVDDGKLLIKQSGKQHSLFGVNNQIGKVTIYIPEGKTLEDVDIHLGVGEAYIENMTTDTLDLNGGVGEIIIKNLVSKETDIKVGVGEIEIQGDLQGETSIKGGVGGLYLDLVGDEKAYSYDIEKGIGETTINNHTYEAFKDVKENNDGANLISIKTGIGEIRVKTN